jgi:hypothetical protein
MKTPNPHAPTAIVRASAVIETEPPKLATPAIGGCRICGWTVAIEE